MKVIQDHAERSRSIIAFALSVTNPTTLRGLLQWRVLSVTTNIVRVNPTCYANHPDSFYNFTRLP